MTTNITTPNGAGTPVTKTFTVARHAAGDQSAVLYLREGANQTAFPKLEASTKAAQVRGTSGRKGTTTLMVPYGTVDANGVFVKINHASAVVITDVPDDAPDSVRNDLAAFLPGLWASADGQLKDVVRKGYMG